MITVGEGRGFTLSGAVCGCEPQRFSICSLPKHAWVCFILFENTNSVPASGPCGVCQSCGANNKATSDGHTLRSVFNPVNTNVAMFLMQYGDIVDGTLYVYKIDHTPKPTTP